MPHPGPPGCAPCARRAPGAGGGAAGRPRRPSAVPRLPWSVHLLDGDQVAHRVDHAPELGLIVLDDHVTDPLEPQRPQRVPLLPGAADLGLGLGNPQLRHQPALAQFVPAAALAAAAAARARSMAAGATSSIGRPRRAAISSGRFSDLSAATVAWTTLIALEEPGDRDSTSCTPAHSRTARTGPPAMTPVPGLAGLSSTTPAAASPCTVCGIVPPMRGTRKKCFFAASTPLAIAAGTSLAFPYQTPTNSCAVFCLKKKQVGARQ